MNKFFAGFKLTDLTGLQIFQLLRYATFILVGVGFAKLHLSVSAIGYFETLLLVSGMVSFFWISGIINSMLSVYPKRDEAGKRILLFNTFLLLCLFSIVTGALLFAFSDNLLAFLDKRSEGNIVQLAVLYLLLNAPSYIIEYILFLHKKSKGLIYYGLFIWIATLIACIVPIAWGYSIEYSIYGLIVVTAIKLLYALWLLSRYADFKLDYATLLTGAKLSLPLMLSLFVSGSAEYIDGMIVKAKFDDVFFAIYRFGARELPILLILANTFSTAMVPAIADNTNEGIAQLKSKSARFMHFFFPLTIVLMLCSPFLYVWVFNESFLYSALIFNIYLLLIIPRLVFPQTILTALQHSKWLLLSSVLEIAINVSLSLYLSSKIGLPGIAIGTLVAYCFDKIFLIILNMSVLKLAPRQYIPLRLLGVYSLLTLFAFVVSYWFLKGY